MSRIDGYRNAAQARVKLVLLAYMIRTLGALVTSWILAHSLTRANVMALPRMDKELFAPGARVLLQTLAEHRGALSPWQRFAWPLGLLTIIFGALASTVILSALASPAHTRASVWLRRAVRAVPTNLALTLAGWALFGGVLFAATLGFGLVPSAIYPVAGEKGADLALAILAIFVAFLGLVTFTVVDLARAANAQTELGARESLGVALECIGNRFRVCTACALGYGILVVVVPAVVELSLPRALTLTSGRLILTFFVHQLTVIGLCALHLGWWAFAIRILHVPSRQEGA